MRSKTAVVTPRIGQNRRLDAAQVVSAGASLVDENGTTELTWAAVANSLDVKPPSLYAHLSGLQDLRFRVAALGLDELAEEIGRSSVGRSGDELIASLSHAYRAFAKRRPGVYEATLIWASNTNEIVAAAGSQLSSLVIEMLEPTTGNLAPDDRVHLLRMMRSLLHGFVSLENGGGFASPVDIEETFKHLVLQLIAMLKAYAQK